MVKEDQEKMQKRLQPRILRLAGDRGGTKNNLKKGEGWDWGFSAI